jgi:hypothetical protein
MSETKPDRCPTCNSDRVWARRAPWCTWPDDKNGGEHDKWHDIPTEPDAPKPETQAERLRREAHQTCPCDCSGAYRDGYCIDETDDTPRYLWPAHAAIDALADALAEKEATIELLEGEVKAAETLSGMDNVIAQFESQLKVEREENASLLKRAEAAERDGRRAGIGIALAVIGMSHESFRYLMKEGQRPSSERYEDIFPDVQP